MNNMTCRMGVISFFFLLVLSFNGFAEDKYADTKGAPVPDNPDAVPDEILVRFKPSTADETLRDLEVINKVKTVRKRKFRKMDWHRIRVKSPKKIKEIIEIYREHPDVLYAEPNYYVKAIGTPNDAMFSQLWGLNNTGQTGGEIDADIDAAEAWDVVTSSEVVVAVIDTGVDYNHPDLAANIWSNKYEIPDNGIDDDSNGYIDDVQGWDFAYDDNDPMDGHDHGTHCSGTIGGIGNNGAGVAGVCWQVKIMPVKFLSDYGSGSIADAVDAVEYATLMGAKVLNNSWGGGGYSGALRAAIQAADDAGVLFIAAAGNSARNNDVSPHYPSSYDVSNVIAVAASTHSDTMASFSCYGLTSVDLAAPGKDVVSTVADNDYDSFSGTSMATPHVAGACALIWAAGGPGMPHSMVKQVMFDGVDPLPAFSGKCVTGGRLNLANSINIGTTNRIVVIQSPRESEGFEQAYLLPLEWQGFGQPWQAGDKVKIEYSGDACSNWNIVVGATNLDYDAGSFNWDTTGLGVGTQYNIRVTSLDDLSVVETSETFAVAGPLDHFDVSIASPQSNQQRVRGECRVTAMDSNDIRIVTFQDFNTAGRFPVSMTASNVSITGLSGPGNQLATANFEEGIADLAALGMSLAVSTTPTTTQFTATSANSATGISDMVAIDILPDYFTEEFSNEVLDLTNTSVILVPNGSINYYTACTRAITNLPTDPSSGTTLSLGDDQAIMITLAGAFVHLYGVSYDKFFIGSNGYITFESGDATYYESLVQHFLLPRISPLFRDFTPDDGDVTWQQFSNRVVVTYYQVPEYGIDNSSTFQVEMFFDGQIVLSYLEIEAPEGIVGLSEGEGVPADFFESDLSYYPAYPDRLLILTAPIGGESVVTGSVVDVSWSAFGDSWLSTNEVQLEYSANSGGLWNSIAAASNLNYALGSFSWDTAGLSTGHSYRVKISFVTNSAVNDASSDFALISDRSLDITYPSGNDLFETNALITVTWSQAGSAWLGGDIVKLEYSTNAGVAWVAIVGAESLLYNAGIFDWDTTGLQLGQEYLIKITWLGDSAINDVSGGAFVFRRIYYVNDGSTTNDIWCGAPGDDANSGKTPGSPKASLQAIVASYDLEQGDAVRIDTGIYSISNTITIGQSDSGSSIGPVIIEGSPYGTVLDAGGSGDNVIRLSSAEYIFLRTVTSTNHPAVQERPMILMGGASGIYLTEAQYCTFDWLDLSYNDYYGIEQESCSFIVCSNSLIYSNNWGGTFSDYCAFSDFVGCEIYGNDGYGISAWDTAGSAVRNNLIRHNTWGGFDLWYFMFGTLENNTIAWNEWSQIEISSDSMIIQNNIICADDTSCIDVYWEMPDSDYNIFMMTNGAVMGYMDNTHETLAEWRSYTGQDTHSVVAIPTFINSSNDWHLQSTAGSYHDGSWSLDAITSLGIDMGYGDVVAESAPNATPWHSAKLGKRNVGAYGSTDQASKTPTNRMLVLYEPIEGQSFVSTSQPVNVRWTWIGTDWQSNDTVKIEYSDDSGGTWTNMVGGQNVPVTNGLFAWDVSVLIPGYNYRVRLTCNQDGSALVQNKADVRIGASFAFYLNNSSTNNDEWCAAAGDDANDGLTPATPKATLDSILSAYDLEPGDTVYIDTGEYGFQSDISIDADNWGTSNAPVTFEASPFGVVFNLSNRTWYVYASYVTIRTGTSTNYPGVAQEYMKVTGGNVGLYVRGDHCVLERLDIVSNASQGVVGYYYADPLTLRNSLVRDNGSYGLYLRYCYDSVIENNTFINNEYRQIYNYYTRDAVFRNNIFQVDDYGDYAIYCSSVSYYPVSDYNIFCLADGARLGYFGGIKTTLQDWRDITGQDANSVAENPLFVNPGSEDYHVQSVEGSYHGGLWTADGTNSLAVDTGYGDVGAEPAPNSTLSANTMLGKRNIGAYGGTEQASKTFSGREILLNTPADSSAYSDQATPVEVNWSWLGAGWQSNDTVKLEYSNDAGGTWSNVVGGATVPVTNGLFSWDISSLTEGMEYRFKLTCVQDVAVADSNAFNFRIGGGLIFYVNDGSTNNDEWCAAIGNDGNSGTSSNSPKATVQAVLDSFNLESGDEVWIDTGIYNLTNNIIINAEDGGTSNDPVVFAASPCGVTINRGDTNSGKYVWQIAGADYVTIQTAVSTNQPGATQSWMKVTGGYCGVYNDGSFAQISRLDVCSNYYYGVYIASGGDNAILENCLVRDGIYPYGRGIYTSSGLWRKPFAISNCTVAAAGRYGMYLYYGDGTKLRNNIIYADGSGAFCIFQVSASIDSDYNLFYVTNGANVGYSGTTRATLVDWRAATSQDANSTELDPLFIDLAGKDYHIQSKGGSYHEGAWTADGTNSLAIDAGYGDVGTEPAPNATVSANPMLLKRNMGAYGGTEQASKTFNGRELMLNAPADGSAYLSQVTPVGVNWSWLGAGWQSNDTVKLEYSDDSGNAWTNVNGGTNVFVTNAVFSWDVSAFTPGYNYRTKVTCNQDGGVVVQNSDDFRIGGPFTFYVNNSSTNNDEWCIAIGSDTNNGLSAAAPKATVWAVAGACNLEPGDVIRIDTGAYVLTNNITVDSLDNGTLANPVIFEMSPYGVSFDRGGQVYGNNAFEIRGDYVVFRTVKSSKYPGLPQSWARITNAYYAAYFYYADNCSLERLSVSDSYRGIYAFYSQFFACRNSLMYNNTYYGVILLGCNDGLLENNSIMFNNSRQVYIAGRRNSLRNNIIYADGAGDYGIYVSSTFYTIDSDYNIVYVTNGAYAGYYGVINSTLADWQAATGQDTNSLNMVPLFVDPAGDDYHLQSVTGSYHAAAWTTDAANSPGIDTGDPAYVYTNEPAWDGGFINMGAYGNTKQASKSLDSDAEGLSDTFELFRLGTYANDADSDDDNFSDWEEYLQGTDPMSGFSPTTIYAALFNSGTPSVTLYWRSVSNRIYTVECSTNSEPGTFISLSTNIPSSPPVNVYADTVTGIKKAFYRIKERQQ